MAADGESSMRGNMNGRLASKIGKIEASGNVLACSGTKKVERAVQRRLPGGLHGEGGRGAAETC